MGRTEKILDPGQTVPHLRGHRRDGRMMVKTIRHCMLACLLTAGTALAQTPSVQDLQNKLQQFEESSQRQIEELKAQIATLQAGQKSVSTLPLAEVTSQAEVPKVSTPVEYYGTETRTRQTA